MKFKNFVRKFLIEILVSIVFIVFMGWLIYIAIVGSRSPIFFDALSQVDVTSSYTSNLHFFRGIFEPIIGSFLIIGLEFEYWIMILIIAYPIVRAIVLLLDKFRYNQRIKSNIISVIFQDALRFTFIWGLLVFLLGIITFGIGYLVVGVLFLSNNFRWILKVISWTSMALFTGKLAYNIIMRGIKHNNNHLKYLQIRTKILSKIRQIKLKNFLISSKKEIMKFLAMFWFVLMLTQGMQYIYIPTQTIETTLGPNEFLFDLHCHTTYSDGILTPRQRVNWYIDQGIHGAAFSDHHNLGGAIHAQEYVDRKNLDFTVIKAQEFTDDPEGIHLNIYGETDVVVIPDNYWGEENTTETLSCREAILWAKSEGLYVTVNHYEANSTAPFTFEQLRDWGVDGFEIVNGAREQAADIRQFCLDNNLICMGGTDVHMNEDLDTFIKLTLADPNNKTVDAIFDALYQNTHEVVYIKYRPEEKYSSIDLIEDLINYFHGLSLFQSLSWIAWTMVGYVASILLIKAMKLNNEQIKINEDK
ncbi:MAG: PHP domain-containing protein [Promethearchaeota archaeon]